MSTKNFTGNDYFDDYAYVYEKPSDDYIKSFEEENGWEFSVEVQAELDYELEYDNAKFEIERALKDYNITLFNIEVRSGYYNGLELIVTSDISELKVNDICDIENLKYNYDNNDMRYYFGHLAEYKSHIIPKIKAEINRMNKKVLPRISQNTGFDKVNLVAVLSNGEGVYEWVK
jgi:hypothetical protein